MSGKFQATIDELQRRLFADDRVNASINFRSYDGHRYLNLIPAVECIDGFTVSVQASHTHYCTPRNSEGPWTEVELGFPSKKVPSLRQYRDGPPPDTDTVFAYVPIEKVAALLVRHGGLKPIAKASPNV